MRKDLAEKVIAERYNRPMFFIDIAVPRDIEPSVNEIDNCYLYDIDDLQSVVEANMAEREREAKSAEEIVKKEVTQFFAWLDHLEMAPAIVELKDQMETLRRRELDKTLGRLPDLTDKQKEAIGKMTESMINKVIHPPIVNLKKKAETEQGHEYLKALRYLFNLEE